MTQFYHFKSSPPITKLPSPLPYKVLIATPTTRDLVPSYVASLAATIETLVHFGVAFEVGILDGDCHVDDVRNRMIRDFLDGDCTDLLFIDSDLGWQSRNVMRLIEAEGDIVAGVYRLKTDEESYPFHPGEGVREANADGLFTMPKAATGFMRIRRHVLEALYAREKESGRFTFAKKDTSPNPICRIVERAFAKELKLSVDTGDGADYHSGDYVLCLKARDMGFSVLVDVEMAFEHVGSKSWIGHCGNFLRAEKGIDHPKFTEAMNDLKRGDTSPATYRNLVSYSAFPPFAFPPEGYAAIEGLIKDGSGNILECGSGITSLVMGAWLHGTDRIVYSIEHDLEWVRRVERWLATHGITNVVPVYAPLHPVGTDVWYGLTAEDLPPGIETLFIDGPPGAVGPRSAGFEILGDLMASARTVIVDDCQRPDYKKALLPHLGNRDIQWIEGVSGDASHLICIATQQGYSS